MPAWAKSRAVIPPSVPNAVTPSGRVVATKVRQANTKPKFHKVSISESRRRELISEKPANPPARLRLASPSR